MNQIKHVAIIMDGNGRWAQSRFKPRVWGHIRGSKIVSSIVETADDMSLKSLTLYAFSTENWSRPLTEIDSLFKLLEKYLLKERKRIIKNDIKFKVIGQTSKLPTKTQKLIHDLEQDTKNNQGLNLNFAFSYGGKDELVKTFNILKNKYPDRDITEDDIQNHLMMKEDIDLLIRTGGDTRVSNFLLWQTAYAELYFTDIKWPEFTPAIFKNIINDVSQRSRRFGSLDNTANYQEIGLKIEKNLKEIHYE